MTPNFAESVIPTAKLASDMPTEDQWNSHLKEDEAFQDKMSRVLFGEMDIDGEQARGIKQKVDEMHALLIQARSVKGFFSGFGSLGRWVFVIAGVVLILKTFGISVLAWLNTK